MFRAVVDCGGVGAAADHLGIAQPSVTAHIRALETHMGARLFLRSPGRKNLITPSGEALYRFACEMLLKSSELQSIVRGYDAEPPQQFSIVVQRALANYRMPGVMVPFLRTHPSVQLSLYGETQEGALRLLQAGTVDAAIAFDTPETSVHEGSVIGDEGLVIVAAPSHALAASRRVPLRDLDSFDFVGGLRDSQFYALISRTLRASGMKKYHTIMHMQDSVGIKNAVVCGMGLACTLSCVVEQEIAEGKLFAIETDPPLPALPIRFMANPKSPNPKLVDQFYQSLVSALASARRASA